MRPVNFQNSITILLGAIIAFHAYIQRALSMIVNWTIWWLLIRIAYDYNK